jgi:hypothetical protein
MSLLSCYNLDKLNIKFTCFENLTSSSGVKKVYPLQMALMARKGAPNSTSRYTRESKLYLPIIDMSILIIFMIEIDTRNYVWLLKALI